ncbi:MAG: asparagine synthase (glutamine-hydrolyzing) [bacterium]|nr:asparagine synthase (glutamine-hydrolyzing) [bacterium]
MCGIFAMLTPKSEWLNPADWIDGALEKMSHRGPDDAGVWCDSEKGIALGHRRLSIFDLSPAGHQPMHSRDGRWVMVYNGEVYNWRDLRRELEEKGVAFHSNSDTEVLLESVALHGVDATVRKCVGMFAFAAWDRVNKVLYLVRDRMGEKPLYYGWHQGAWWAASELKSLRAVPGLNFEIDRRAIRLFMRRGYIPAPYSIYRSIQKLTPGVIAVLQPDGTSEFRPYWSFAEAVRAGRETPFRGGEDDAAAELETLLLDAVRGQREADVPVGAFLSGGIDSSSVTALMQSLGGSNVKTFSIGFHEKSFDESHYAREVASHLHTDHTELIVSPSEAWNVIPELASIYDEPFADSSAVPTVLVCRLAKQKVTVALSGDGGDELFGGYSRYRVLERAWNARKRYLPLARAASFAFKCGEGCANVLNLAGWSERFRWRKHLYASNSYQSLYHGQFNEFYASDALLDSPPGIEDDWNSIEAEGPVHFAMACDSLQYLPGDILVKVDRAAMSCSLETRIPLLDHRIVEWAWTLPLSLKYDGASGKKILKRLLARYVPASMFERPKQGFGVPVGEWIRTALLDWTEELLSESALKQTGVFSPAAVRSLWMRHKSGQVDFSNRIWSILMLQDWLTHGGSAGTY